MKDMVEQRKVRRAKDLICRRNWRGIWEKGRTQIKVQKGTKERKNGEEITYIHTYIFITFHGSIS
jgi:hypothetical protein